MAAWHLAFNHPHSLSIEACERLLATFANGDVDVVIGEMEGNPRDFYTRAVTMTGQRGALRVELQASQGLRGVDEPEPIISSVAVRLDTAANATFTTKLAAWRELQAAFAQLGCREYTLEMNGAAILDEATAAGDTAAVALLREAISAALIAAARITASVQILSPRVDIEPILAAYLRPEAMATMSLADCGLTALPSGFARFPNLQTLSIHEDAFDGSVLRGVSLPQLGELTLRGTSLRRVTKEDLAGFPALETLRLSDSALEALDPAILEVCPDLVRVYVDDTPLAADAAAMATLRQRWPGMKWSYYDESTRARPKDRTAVTIDKPAPPPPPFVEVAPLASPPRDPVLQPFFEAILAAPEDDAPRLALAKLLRERGDPRGEQIDLACEFAKVERDDPRYETLQRCAVMPQFYFFSGASYPFLGRQTPRRGFVEEILCTPRDFFDHADVLLHDAPIRGYIADGCSDVEELAASPALATLRRLELRWDFTDEARAVVLASPHLRQTLQTLSVHGRFEDPDAVDRLAAELRPLAALRTLTLTGTLAQPAVARLLVLLDERRIEQLDVELCTLKPEGLIATLWQRLGDARVTPRRLPRVPFHDGVLDLSSPMYSVEQIAALIASGAYRGATRINLCRTHTGDAVVALLARSRAFPTLVELNVGDSGVTDVGVHVLADQAVGLDALATISLGGPDHTGHPPGVSDSAVAALAHSARLPALRTVTRHIEHHCYSEGAREDTEVVELARGDGRVVASKTYHFIWP